MDQNDPRLQRIEDALNALVGTDANVAELEALVGDTTSAEDYTLADLERDIGFMIAGAEA